MTIDTQAVQAYRFPALPLLALAYASGVVAGAVLGGPWPPTLLLAATLAVVAMLRGDPRRLLLATAVVVCVIGHIRMHVT